jgi:hypothetical protein
MTYYIQTVTSAPVPGREDDYHHWYEHTHMPEVLRVPGFVSGRRYVEHGDGGGLRYLAVYEIQTDDIDATLAAMAAAGPRMTLSDALDPQSLTVTVYEALAGQNADAAQEKN